MKRKDALIIVGIDPGKSGGVAAVGNVDAPVVVENMAMPTLPDGTVDVAALQDFLIRVAPNSAVVERPYILGRQKGALTIGANFGRLTATLDLCGVPYTLVRPQSWQKEVLVVGGDDTKEASVATCLTLNLTLQKTSSRSNARWHDGVSDANLIALYGLLASGRDKRVRDALKRVYGEFDL